MLDSDSGEDYHTHIHTQTTFLSAVYFGGVGIGQIQSCPKVYTVHIWIYIPGLYHI